MKEVDNIQIIESEVPVSNDEYLSYWVDKNTDYLLNQYFPYTQLVDHIKSASVSYNRFSEEISQRQKSLSYASESVTDHLSEVSSSIYVSAAYLLMKTELDGLYTPEQIVEIFKAAIECGNNMVNEVGDKKDQTHLLTLMNKGLKTRRFIKKEKLKYSQRYVENVPEWYKGDNAGWILFIMSNCSKISLYRNSNVTNTRVGIYAEKLDGKIFGDIIEDKYPEWYSSLRNSEVNDEDVERELMEDVNEYALHKKIENTFTQKIKDLDKLGLKRWVKSASYFEKRRKELSDKNTDFMKLSFFMIATNSLYSYPNIDQIDENANIDPNKIVHADPQKTQLLEIEKFFKKNKIHAPFVGLWLEKKLKESKLPSTINPAQLIDFMRKNPSEEDFYKLKEMDKNLHKSLKYVLYPVYQLLNEEEKEYLSEITDLKPGKMKLLDEIADVFCQHLRRNQNPDPNIERNIDEIYGFSKWWIIKNKDNLRNMILQSKSYKTPEQELDIKFEEKEDSIEIVQDFERDDLKVINLSQRNIVLVDRKSGNLDGTIVGSDVDELSKSLDSLFTKNNLEYSIKTKSVIRAIDWFLQVPDSIRNIWPKETVGGVEYYKVKRGAVRIFCRIDKESDTVPFFLYQKQDMGYRF